MRYLKDHLYQYLMIFVLFGVVVYALQAPISGSRKLTFGLVAVGVYLFWGVWHHWENHDLNWGTVLEYVVLSLFLVWLLINLVV